jgi:membrane-associated phospholipid phosphatase
VFIAAMAWACLRSHWRGSIVLWATTTASSRVLLGRHYVGDVLAGTLLGLALAAFLTGGTFNRTHLWIPMPTAFQ